MKPLSFAFLSFALFLPASEVIADSDVKNETSDYQFVRVTCRNGSYEKRVDPGRRIVITSKEYAGGTCSIKVEGQSSTYRIYDHNGYQISPKGTITKTAG